MTKTITLPGTPGSPVAMGMGRALAAAGIPCDAKTVIGKTTETNKRSKYVFFILIGLEIKTNQRNFITFDMAL